MSFAIPLVLVSEAGTREDALREANAFAAANGDIGYVGEPVEYPTPDYEALGALDPSFAAVVEVR